MPEILQGTRMGWGMTRLPGRGPGKLPKRLDGDAIDALASRRVIS